MQCYALGDIRFGFVTYNLLPGWKKQAGVKRSGSFSGSKPNRAKRLKMRALKAAEEASGRTPSQPAPGITGVRSELGDLVNRPQQEEELEDVMILEKDDEVLSEDLGLVLGGSVLGSEGSRPLPPEPRKKRMAFPDELDFKFEIPHEEMDL